MIDAKRFVDSFFFFFFQAEDGIRYYKVTGVQTCALPIYSSETSFSNDSEGGTVASSRRRVIIRRRLTAPEERRRRPAATTQERFFDREAAFGSLFVFALPVWKDEAGRIPSVFVGEVKFAGTC